MATQIQPTPILRGEDARRVLEELKKKPDPSYKKGAEKLRAKFEGKVKKV